MTITISSFDSFTGTDDSELQAKCVKKDCTVWTVFMGYTNPVQCIVLCSVLVDWPSSTMVYA